MSDACDLLHLRPLGPGLWLSKTQHGSYAVCEHSDGQRCGATTVCGGLENAENYASYVVNKNSPGGQRWVVDHGGLPRVAFSTLADLLSEYATTYAAPGSVADTAVRRAFMAGALAALTSPAPREHLIAECVQFGRAIGTAAERAKA